MPHLKRLLLVVFAAAVSLSTSSTSCSSRREVAATAISRAEFGRLVTDISEEGGFFWSNNYISNETSYLHVLDELERLQVRGGIYVGVGPNQNFTYMAHLRPKAAFIVDIRRQNLLEHLLFKVLVEKSPTRHEFLSSLTGRPIRGDPLAREAAIESVLDAVEAQPRDVTFFDQELGFLLAELSSRPELDLSSADLRDLERVYRQFFGQGLDIKYDSWRAFFFPTLREFILATDLQGRRRNWLVSDETYQVVRDMQLANRIVPIVGDFSGSQAFLRLGAELRRRGETVSCFYVSNVEFYLFRQRTWPRFVENVRHLPIDDRSVFIRAYANLHRPHPRMIGDHITVSLVQPIRPFLQNFARGRYRDLWDVVTLDN